MIDQLRVVAGSTIYSQGSQVEQLQHISQCLPVFVGARRPSECFQSAAEGVPARTSADGSTACTTGESVGRWQMWLNMSVGHERW